MRSVRVKFKKFGSAKYISHLDLNRFMIKAVRRSGIPVWYSEGFNPHPYITFALPLSLGFDSEYEFMDIRLDDDCFKNEEVFHSIKDLMPDGLLIESCDDPVMKAGDIAYAEYKISFNFEDAKLMGDICNFLSMDVITAQKKTKNGNYKDIDLKEYIKDYTAESSGITITLAAGGSNNLNPKLVLDSFENSFGVTLPYYQITRTMLYNEKMEAFK